MPSPTKAPLLPWVALPHRPDVDPRSLLTRLAPTLSDAPLSLLGEGWDNVVYAVGAGHVLRVAKWATAAERTAYAERDAALLTFAERHSSLPTNKVLGVLPEDGALLLTRVTGECLASRPLRDEERAAFAERMGAFLTRLHSVPSVEAALVVSADLGNPRWLDETARGWARVCGQGAIEEVLGREGRQRVEAFLTQPVPLPPRRTSFCHNDLGDKHIHVDPDTGALTGVIDWSDAVLDDPARDLALLALDVDPVLLDAVLGHYAAGPDPDLRDRALWHAARAGVQDVTWRTTNAPQSLPGAWLRLRRVLDEVIT